MKFKPDIQTALIASGLTEPEIAVLLGRFNDVASSYEGQAAGYKAQVESMTAQLAEYDQLAALASSIVNKITE